MKTILTPVSEVAAFVVIIRCIWERGQNQDDALRELQLRGLWLSPEQRLQAGFFEPVKP